LSHDFGVNDRQVTGIISVPGDIDRAARAAAKGFDRVIVRRPRFAQSSTR
jgi:hypothetical protein